MSAKISGTFLRAALGPIQYAAGLVTSNKVRQGIEELSPDSLVGGLKRGIREVAALVGVDGRDIERVMPMAQVRELEERLSVSQPAAVAAWNLHAGQYGFMDVITALTIDGRKAEIGLCLARVAKKVAADVELATPLEALAVDVTAWEELIVRCRHILEDRGWLAAAYGRKRRKRALMVGGALVVIVASVSLIFYVKTSRDRIDHALAGSDPCSISIDARDARFASRDQDRAISAAKARCETDRQKKAETERIEREAAEAERKKQEAITRRLDGCAKLAASVVDGSFSIATGAAEVDPKTGGFLERLSQKRLAPEDIGPDNPAFPCGDTDSVKEIEKAFASALMADPTLWSRRGDPSPFTEKTLLEQKDQISPMMLSSFSESAEALAKTALLSGKADVIAKARRLCSTARSLGVPGHEQCFAVAQL